MQIRSRIYPYPVISYDSDSYINSSFLTDVSLIKDGYNVKFIMEAKLTNPGVRELVDKGIVAYVHHIECPQTSFRTAVTTFDYESKVIIEDSKINGLIQVCSFLVAMKDIVNYTNELFNQDYRGFKFNIEKGCIMGIGNQVNLRVNKIKDDLANTSSIFSIIPNLEPSEVNVKVDVSKKDKICIIIPEKTCNLYKNMSQMLGLQPVMHAMVIIPALMYVLQELKSAKYELYNYEDCRWFRAFSKTANELGIEITEQGVDSIDIYQAAQQLLRTPLIKAMEFLSSGDEVESV